MEGVEKNAKKNTAEKKGVRRHLRPPQRPRTSDCGPFWSAPGTTGGVELGETALSPGWGVWDVVCGPDYATNYQMTVCSAVVLQHRPAKTAVSLPDHVLIGCAKAP